MRHALVAVLLAFVPCLASDQEAFADFVVPVPTYDTVVPELFRVELERGPTRTAAYIEPHADGMVKLTALDGGFGYVPMSRIKRILDEDGRDVTRDVVVRRLNLGSFEGQSFRNPMATANAGEARASEVWKPFRAVAAPSSACRTYLITDF